MDQPISARFLSRQIRLRGTTLFFLFLLLSPHARSRVEQTRRLRSRCSDQEVPSSREPTCEQRSCGAGSHCSAKPSEFQCWGCFLSTTLTLRQEEQDHRVISSRFELKQRDEGLCESQQLLRVPLYSMVFMVGATRGLTWNAITNKGELPFVTSAMDGHSEPQFRTLFGAQSSDLQPLEAKGSFHQGVQSDRLRVPGGRLRRESREGFILKSVRTPRLWKWVQRQCGFPAAQRSSKAANQRTSRLQLAAGTASRPRLLAGPTPAH